VARSSACIRNVRLTLARQVGLDFSEGRTPTTAVMLQDVGEVYAEFAPLLRKEGKLTDGPELEAVSCKILSLNNLSNSKAYLHRASAKSHDPAANLHGSYVSLHRLPANRRAADVN
jgi:hypothetical protein